MRFWTHTSEYMFTITLNYVSYKPLAERGSYSYDIISNPYIYTHTHVSHKLTEKNNILLKLLLNIVAGDPSSSGSWSSRRVLQLPTSRFQSKAIDWKKCPTMKPKSTTNDWICIGWFTYEQRLFTGLNFPIINLIFIYSGIELQIAMFALTYILYS